MAMNTLEELHAEAYEEDIHVEDYPLPPTIKAMCLYDDPSKNIILNRQEIVSRAEETVLLAEEIGHYKTGALYVLKSNFNSAIVKK